MNKKYDTNNKGTLWSKEKSKETQPDFTGTCELDNRKFSIGAWVKVEERGPKAGETCLNMCFQEMFSDGGYGDRNWGTLYKVEKPASDRHPQYDGECLIDGHSFKMAAFNKTVNKDGPNKGKHFKSLSFTPESSQPPQSSASPARQEPSRNSQFESQLSDYSEDDIPF